MDTEQNRMGKGAMAERGVGRPTKAPKPGTRVSLGLKVHAETKERLDAAARRNGWTQSREAEARLERSFEREDMLPELLSLRYGRRLAALLMMLGDAIERCAAHAGHLSKPWGASVRDGNWFDDPYAFDQATAAGGAIIEALRPAGAVHAPEEYIEVHGEKDAAELGVSGAADTIRAAVRGVGRLEGEAIRSFLGDELIERLRNQDDKR